ncbi:hemerythrin HHE cation binding domain-containing protein [Tepidamorphus gemmatus]|uniref:Hemerythrin HHE cation binding domain-containing protein n=1 Tax=Tepidamorphus gemmatus TaxID=747076 RepID=A0A4V2UYQ7_9HYPH|nr:hemerythrin domain-containing protein [Tepidamorphus gemmatus]TCT08398.1 hemerythrin HHE cation binding domain-containing protein [Tepidamorphus gemmatus]
MTDNHEASLALDRRAGWPAEMRRLLDKYPRPWTDRPDLGQLSRFWLGRHDMFRELNTAMLQASQALKAGTVPPEAFRTWFQPRIRFFLGELHGHHMIEDQHYFPVLMRIEADLARGFTVLEADHEAIHEGLATLQSASNDLLNALAGPPDRRRFAADAMSERLDGFLKSLVRHLDDEEDLIIPILLDRGENLLG